MKKELLPKQISLKTIKSKRPTLDLNLMLLASKGVAYYIIQIAEFKQLFLAASLNCAPTMKNPHVHLANFIVEAH